MEFHPYSLKEINSKKHVALLFDDNAELMWIDLNTFRGREKRIYVFAYSKMSPPPLHHPRNPLLAFSIQNINICIWHVRQDTSLHWKGVERVDKELFLLLKGDPQKKNIFELGCRMKSQNSFLSAKNFFCHLKKIKKFIFVSFNGILKNVKIRKILNHFYNIQE